MAQKIHIASLVNKDFIRKIDPKVFFSLLVYFIQTLVWPKHANHLFLDATPVLHKLPLTRRVLYDVWV